MSRQNFVRCAFVTACAAIVTGSCREAPTPFESLDQEFRSLTEPVQLTINAGTDHMPAWSAAGDSVYYSASSFAGLSSQSNGVLLALAPESGPARLLIPELQANVQLEEWLTAPAISRDGEFIALIQLHRLAAPTLCSVSCPEPYYGHALPGVGFPQLDSLQIRLFSTKTRSITDVITLRFNDRTFDRTRPWDGVAGTWVFDMRPYQARWAAEQTSIFRPAWSPDGESLVFSDGQQLRIWTRESVRPIPNTADAILPAWSPDGQTIAFTKVDRGVTERTICDCVSPTGFLSEMQERIVYSGSLADGTITLIRPDGSDKREIGRGDAPAWTPNGQLVFRRDGALYRSNGDGSNATLIPGTNSGHMPSVSPSGRFIAFSRANTGNGRFDIWVAPLAGAQ